MYMKADRRTIRCPLCLHGRLLDVAEGANLPRLALYGPLQADRAQIFLKCPKCGQQIGISLGKIR